MDSEKIISEGLLEQYLLGELEEQQISLVEAALKKDAGLRATYAEMEADFERIAFENAIEPPDAVKKSLKFYLEEIDSRKDKAVKDLKSRDRGFQNGRLLVAASLAAIFALSSFWIYNRWQNAEQLLQLQEEQITDLQDRLVKIEERIEVSDERYRKINNLNVTPLVLVGNAISPESKAVAYINHRTKEVVVNGQGLSPLSSGEAYQMWADVEGEMINMGLVSVNEEFIDMSYIEGAESLNITIEPSGGSEHPTVERLISSVSL
ncbi:MAG: anti-sigma factor [Flavobacteriaceae bacterium]